MGSIDGKRWWRAHRRSVGRWGVVVAAVAVAATFSQPLAGRADLSGTTSAATQAALSTLVLGPSTPGLQTLPVDGNAALARAIAAVGTDLGVPTDGTARIASAQLPGSVTARLAVVLQDAHACAVITANALHHLQAAVPSPLGEEMPSIPDAFSSALRQCAATLYSDGLALKDFVKSLTAGGTAPGPGKVLDAWPVVHLDLTGAGHEYDWDYVLTVATGNNHYYNNAGSNVIDPFNGPLNGQPARGCELVSEILGANVPKCVLAASLLIQVGGTSNVFGHFQTPDADAFLPGTSTPCTTSNLVRRIFTEGSAVAGVGILINDSSANNTYLGKVGAQARGTSAVSASSTLKAAATCSTASATRRASASSAGSGSSARRAPSTTSSPTCRWPTRRATPQRQAPASSTTQAPARGGRATSRAQASSAAPASSSLSRAMASTSRTPTSPRAPAMSFRQERHSRISAVRAAASW